MKVRRLIAACATLLVWSAVACASDVPTFSPDIPANFIKVTPEADYVRREVMIPMRDGVRLFTSCAKARHMGPCS